MVNHPIPPVFSKDAKVLILGSFPSVKSRETGFFYGHPQNRFWSVLSEILDCPTPETVEQKRNFLHTHSIALWDVIASCEIKGSSDSSIENAIPNDISEILNNANIKAIFTNGKTADRLYKKYIEKTSGIKAVCLPSTSPANAAWSKDRLKTEWIKIKEILNSDA